MTTKTPLDARGLLADVNVVGSLADGREVLAVRIPKGTAFQAWHAFKELYDETGLWPFLTDPERDDRRPTVWAAFAANRQIATSEPPGVTAAELFARWRAEYLEEDEDDQDVDEEELAEIAAEYSCGPLDLPAAPATGKSWAANTEEIGLCPAGPGGIDIPRLIEWSGACNYAITGAQHEAVLSYWHRQYGAELLTLAFDVIELAVPDPPTDPATVARVAEEQVAYCPDIVTQGVGTTTALAQEQVHSHSWFFWWD
ncbi:MAG: DUF4253 domain-containing protein [Catenulispora sp.]|nr:DUF4253 domain-containing protein [Catenulispora sp.]